MEGVLKKKKVITLLPWKEREEKAKLGAGPDTVHRMGKRKVSFTRGGRLIGKKWREKDWRGKKKEGDRGGEPQAKIKKGHGKSHKGTTRGLWEKRSEGGKAQA